MPQLDPRPVNRPPILAAAAALVIACALSAAPAAAQQGGDDFHWEGRVSPGNTLSVRNLNGAIQVERASGDQVVIDARKRWRKGNPADVRVEAARTGSGDGDVMVCALWGEDASCDADGYHNRSRRRNEANDVSVEFTVRVPDGVRLDISTVNGALRIAGATADVAARTVNGSIDASTLGGPVRAETVNGSIAVQMGRMGSEDLSYKTVNGSIRVAVPAALDADVQLKTVNGRISSDFPLTMQGSIKPRDIRARIGQGGRRLSATTVNGSIELVEGRG